MIDGNGTKLFFRLVWGVVLVLFLVAAYQCYELPIP